MEASDGTKRRHLLGVVCATAVIGAVLAPSQALAGGSTTAMPTMLAYGNVGVGASSMMSTQINYQSTTHFDFDSISGPDASQFSSNGGCNNFTSGGAGSCTIQVTFSPTSTGMKTATLTVPNNSANPNVQVSLTGTGTSISLTLSPAMFDFGSVPAGMQSAPHTFTATADGTAAVAVSGVTIAGPNASQFQRTGGTCSVMPFSLTPMTMTSSCTVDLAFAPTTVGANAATLQFTSNAPDSPDTAALSGTASTPPTTVPLVPTVPTTAPPPPPKQCKKGFKLKRGKCVRKKKKKN